MYESNFIFNRFIIPELFTIMFSKYRNHTPEPRFSNKQGRNLNKCHSAHSFQEFAKFPKCKVLGQPDVKDTLHKLHANYVLVPADKAANNVIIVCKKYYIDTLVKELGINNVNINNPTYIPIDDSFETIMKSHNQFITSVELEISEEDQNLPYLTGHPSCINHHINIGL